MSFKDKLKKELIGIFWVFLYFLLWFGALMVIKVLLLKEYKIEFYGVSMVFLGALIAAKTVLILKLLPLGLNKKPAIMEVLLRTFLYLIGVAIILILEQAFEGRHEFGGFLNALKNLSKSADVNHILVNIICVFGALFFYNLGSLIVVHMGKGEFWKMINSPVKK